MVGVMAAGSTASSPSALASSPPDVWIRIINDRFHTYLHTKSILINCNVLSECIKRNNKYCTLRAAGSGFGAGAAATSRFRVVAAAATVATTVVVVVVEVVVVTVATTATTTAKAQRVTCMVECECSHFELLHPSGEFVGRLQRHFFLSTTLCIFLCRIQLKRDIR